MNMTLLDRQYRFPISNRFRDVGRLAWLGLKAALERPHVRADIAERKLIRAAIREAEAIAWQTPFPHLVFPELAREKIERARDWARRQACLLGEGCEDCFAQ